MDQPSSPAPVKEPTTSTPAGRTNVINWLLISAALVIIIVLLFGGSSYGPEKTKAFPIESAGELHIASGIGTLKLMQGSTPDLTVTAPEQYLDWITIEESDNTLTVTVDRPWFKQLFFVSPHKEDVTFELTLPEITKLTVDGLMDVTTPEQLSQESMEVEINGAADISLNLDLGSLSFALDGAGSATMNGTADTQDISIDGAGNFDGRDLIGQNVSVIINGAANADVNTTIELDATINGAGDITYYGNPSDINQEINGVGSISAADESNENTNKENDTNTNQTDDTNTNQDDPTEQA